MLPVTSAPAPEILPSATVSVERAEGSQVPVFVTMVTLQSPSYGVWATAGTALRAAAVKARNAMRMRWMRMNQVPDLCDAGAFIQGQCVQNLLRRGNTKSSLYFKHLMRELVPGRE